MKAVGLMCLSRSENRWYSLRGAVIDHYGLENVWIYRQAPGGLYCATDHPLSLSNEVELSDKELSDEAPVSLIEAKLDAHVSVQRLQK